MRKQEENIVFTLVIISNRKARNTDVRNTDVYSNSSLSTDTKITKTSCY